MAASAGHTIYTKSHVANGMALLQKTIKTTAMPNDGSGKILRTVTKWQDLYFYQKADALYQMTFVFCQRFLPHHDDRTVDQMMCTYLKHLEKTFVTEGGIKERMYAARTGYRKEQDALLAQLKAENAQLKAELARLKAELARLKKDKKQ